MQTQEARNTQTHRGDFPKPIELSEHAVGWLVEEVDAWIQSRQRATRH